MTTTNLQPHQQRVVYELNELEERLEKLSTFIGGSIFCGLPEEDQRLLEAQRHIMSAYVEVLKKRVERFGA
ncbi:hypothetical protein ACFVGI_000859 [Serratia marcescens]|nr:hypothetical protein [Serratia marcescens]